MELLFKKFQKISKNWGNSLEKREKAVTKEEKRGNSTGKILHNDRQSLLSLYVLYI